MAIPPSSQTLLVCTNHRRSNQRSCAQSGSKELADWLENEIEKRGLAVKVDRSVRLGHCQMGPNVRLLGKDFYHESTQEKLIPLLESLDEKNTSGSSLRKEGH